MSESVKNKGWAVTFAGLGINLALGILYAWSVIKGGIPESWGWNNADKALPYTVACIMFAFAVAILAVGNAGGRIIAGMTSDKIGRQWTLFICFLFQAAVIACLYYMQAGGGWMLIMLIVLFIGANYGANLAIFPAVTKDYFGLKSYGLNYGIVFTAWGVGGLVMPRVNGMILDKAGSNGLTFVIIICMLVVGAALTFASRAIAAETKADVAQHVEKIVV
jgi:MFS family permease